MTTKEQAVGVWMRVKFDIAANKGGLYIGKYIRRGKYSSNTKEKIKKKDIIRKKEKNDKEWKTLVARKT